MVVSPTGQQGYLIFSPAYLFPETFDESFNKVTQRGQMDIHIRYFDKCSGKLSTRYLRSQFLVHATADDLVRNFFETMTDLNSRQLVQISMDGPSVNR